MDFGVGTCYHRLPLPDGAHLKADKAKPVGSRCPLLFGFHAADNHAPGRPVLQQAHTGVKAGGRLNAARHKLQHGRVKIQLVLQGVKLRRLLLLGQPQRHRQLQGVALKNLGRIPAAGKQLKTKFLLRSRGEKRRGANPRCQQKRSSCSDPSSHLFNTPD